MTTPLSDAEDERLRDLNRQLGTARLLVGKFVAQIEEHDAMSARDRFTEHGRDLTARIDGLREGREMWQKRVDELVAAIGGES